MFDYGTGPEPRSSQVWAIRPKENAPGFVLEIVLPKSGTYTLVINDLKNDGTDFTLGFYKNDIYGNTGDSRTGKLIQGTSYLGRPLFGDFFFSRWALTGTKNEEVTLILKPRKELEALDLAFNVINAQGESVVPIDRTAVADTIHTVYVLLFGYLIIMGYRALFRKSEAAQKKEEEKIKKPGRTVSIIGLVLLIFMLVFLLG